MSELLAYFRGDIIGQLHGGQSGKRDSRRPDYDNAIADRQIDRKR
jgi:hypothetical protein